MSLKEEEAAIIIQKNTKMFLARNAYKKRKKEEEAATIIQKHFRGFLVRNKQKGNLNNLDKKKEELSEVTVTRESVDEEIPVTSSVDEEIPVTSSVDEEIPVTSSVDEELPVTRGSVDDEEESVETKENCASAKSVTPVLSAPSSSPYYSASFPQTSISNSPPLNEEHFDAKVTMPNFPAYLPISPLVTMINLTYAARLPHNSLPSPSAFLPSQNNSINLSSVGLPFHILFGDGVDGVNLKREDVSQPSITHPVPIWSEYDELSLEEISNATRTQENKDIFNQIRQMRTVRVAKEKEIEKQQIKKKIKREKLLRTPEAAVKAEEDMVVVKNKPELLPMTERVSSAPAGITLENVSSTPMTIIHPKEKKESKNIILPPPKSKIPRILPRMNQVASEVVREDKIERQDKREKEELRPLKIPLRIKMTTNQAPVNPRSKQPHSAPALRNDLKQKNEKMNNNNGNTVVSYVPVPIPVPVPTSNVTYRTLANTPLYSISQPKKYQQLAYPISKGGEKPTPSSSSSSSFSPPTKNVVMGQTPLIPLGKASNPLTITPEQQVQFMQLLAMMQMQLQMNTPPQLNNSQVSHVQKVEERNVVPGKVKTKPKIIGGSYRTKKK
jgi:hypothetical protein